MSVLTTDISTSCFVFIMLVLSHNQSPEVLQLFSSPFDLHNAVTGKNALGPSIVRIRLHPTDAARVSLVTVKAIQFHKLRPQFKDQKSIFDKSYTLWKCGQRSPPDQKSRMLQFQYLYSIGSENYLCTDLTYEQSGKFSRLRTSSLWNDYIETGSNGHTRRSNILNRVCWRAVKKKQ